MKHLIIPRLRARNLTPESLGCALERVGVVEIVAAIPEPFSENAYRAADTLFYIRSEYLNRYRSSGAGNGYAPPGSERVAGGRPDYGRHYFELRAGGGNVNLPREVPPFAPACRRVFRELDRTGTRILALLGSYLGKPHGYFSRVVRGGSHLLRVNHYPFLPPTEDVRLRFPAHRDLGLLTLYLGGAREGLEVQIGNRWLRPSIPVGSLLVAGGNMLALESGGRIRPVLHRVRDAAGRVSIVMFLEPRPDVLLPTGERARDYLARIMKRIRVDP